MLKEMTKLNSTLQTQDFSLGKREGERQKDIEKRERMQDFSSQLFKGSSTSKVATENLKMHKHIYSELHGTQEEIKNMNTV